MSLCIAICVGLSAVPDRHFSYIALISAFAILAAEGTCFLGGLELSDWESWHIQDVFFKRSQFGVVDQQKNYTQRINGGLGFSKNTRVFHTLHTSALRKNPSSSSPILYRSQAPLPLSFLRLEHIHYFHAWCTTLEHDEISGALWSSVGLSSLPSLLFLEVVSSTCSEPCSCSSSWFASFDIVGLIMMPFLYVFVKSVVVESPQPVQAVVRICNSTDDHGEHRSRFVAQNCSWGTRTTANVWDAPSWIQYLFSRLICYPRWLNLEKKHPQKFGALFRHLMDLVGHAIPIFLMFLLKHFKGL